MFWIPYSLRHFVINYLKSINNSSNHHKDKISFTNSWCIAANINFCSVVIKHNNKANSLTCISCMLK